MTDRPVVPEASTPDGIRVVVFSDTWHGHVLDPEEGHAELAPYLDAVLRTIAEPDHRGPDERPGRERSYKEGAGPSRWLMVVIEFDQEPARIVTALGYQHGRSPTGWMP